MEYGAIQNNFIYVVEVEKYFKFFILRQYYLIMTMKFQSYLVHLLIELTEYKE